MAHNKRFFPIKNLLLLTATSACGCLLKAQPREGTFSITPKAGLTCSKPVGDDIAITNICIRQPNIPREDWHSLNLNEDYIKTYIWHNIVKPKIKSGFTVGLDFQYQANKRLAWVAGLNVAQLRSSTDDINKYNLTKEQLLHDGYDQFFSEKELDNLIEYRNNFSIHDVDNRSYYLQVPIMAKLYVYKGLSIQLGPQFDWNFKSTSDVEYECYNHRFHGFGRYGIFSVNDYNYAMELSERFINEHKNFEFSFIAGLNYEYRHLVASVAYNRGITYSAKLRWDDEKQRYRNSTFMFTLGYRFDLNAH